MLYRSAVADARSRWSLAFLSATGLPLIVAIATIGLDTHQMRSSTAAALIGAGMISVLVFPMIAMKLAPRAGAPPTPNPIDGVSRDDFV